MQNSQLWLYLVELIKRWGSKSPKFFKVINVISLVTTILTGLPGLLQQFNVTLPDWASVLQNKVVAIASLVAFIISKLPVESTPVAVTEQGDILKQTDQKALPFTAASEQKSDAAVNLPAAETIK